MAPAHHGVVAYSQAVPKLWTETIDGHHREVRDAILHTTAALAAEHGLPAVTMSQIAGRTGIGRATLSQYFPDVEAIVLAWHHQQVANHLELLGQVRDRADDAGGRLEAVLTAYAGIQQQRVRHHQHASHGTELATFLHQDEHVTHAQHEVHALLRDLLADAARNGDVRDDVSPDELAGYCLHALDAAGRHSSKAVARRLVTVVLSGLRG
jgi:AcrR family transcriptional regulator